MRRADHHEPAPKAAPSPVPRVLREYWWAFATGGGAAVLLGACLTCAGAAWYFGYLGHRTYSRPDFEKKVRGATAGEVRFMLGAPDRTEASGGDNQFTGRPDDPGNDGYWEYHDVTWNPKTGDPDPQAVLWFRHGRCWQVTY